MTSCRLGNDIPLFVDLVTATLSVDRVTTFCRLGDDNPPFGRLCEDLRLSTVRQQPIMMTATVSKLNERNYRLWAIEAETVQFRQGHWKFVTCVMRVPRPPIIPLISGETPTTPKAADEPRDSDYNFEPESTEPAYQSYFDSCLRHWEWWLMNNDKASGQITDMMEPTMHLRYREYKKPKEPWEKINADFEKMVKLDGQHELENLTLCNRESFTKICENSISYRTSRNQMIGGCSRPPWSAVGKQTLPQISSRSCNHSR